MIAIVGAGSNLGGRWSILRAARFVLGGRGVRVEAVSRTYVTPALVPEGALPGPDFLNEAWRVRFDGSPAALLRTLLEVEALFGRRRDQRWAARTLDLDILWLEQPVQRPGLVVPHPELTRRAFALAPLLDVAPELAPTYARHLRGRPRIGGEPLPLERLLRERHEPVRCRIVRRLRVPLDALPDALDRADFRIGATALLSFEEEVEVVIIGEPSIAGKPSP